MLLVYKSFHKALAKDTNGFAQIVFVKNLLDEEKADTQLEIKAAIDEKFTNACK